MRAREWYGWHFPEMGRVIPDNILYAKTVKTMGIRTNATKTDFSAFLEEEMVHELQEAAQISMGTEVCHFARDCFHNVALGECKGLT